MVKEEYDMDWDEYLEEEDMTEKELIEMMSSFEYYFIFLT